MLIQPRLGAIDVHDLPGLAAATIETLSKSTSHIVPKLEIRSSVAHRYYRNTATARSMGAEQQWVAVQQKTFTKWYGNAVKMPESHSDNDV